jgi:UDP-GlcNAc:undecaprenyl-phosphate GlcNAc-1-phosphate transferase
MIRHLIRPLLMVALVATIALAWRYPPAEFYPAVDVVVPGHDTSITLKSVFQKSRSLNDCEGLTGNIVRVTLARCPTCRIVGSRCDSRLSPEATSLLGAEPLPVPSGRLRNGAMAFVSADPEAAAQACEAAAKSTKESPNPIICHRAGQARAASSTPTQIGLPQLVLPLTAAAVAWLVGWFIVRYEHLHRHLTHDAVDGGPQKNHANPTPRIGGVQLVSGLLAGWLMLDAWGKEPRDHISGLLLLCAAPAFTGGLVEDVTKRVGVKERLLMTMLSGALACWLLGAVVSRLGIPFIDPMLAWLPISIAFSCFAVGGITNSVNIIDGFHGLASGVAIIVAATMAYTAWRVGDTSILNITLALVGALVGFFVWNWPRGLIFLGDGGAYLVGALLAEVSILLVVRHPEISPWYPVLLLSHPIAETIFSIGRRTVRQKTAVGGADNNHLHQLVFRRLYGQRGDCGDCNPRVAKFFWAAGVGTCLGASQFWSNSAALMFLVASYFVLYGGFYRKMAARPWSVLT